MDPPGTWLQNAAVLDMIERHPTGKRFLEVGCGDGSLSLNLLARGFCGVGADISEQAIAEASGKLQSSIERGRYALHYGDVNGISLADRFDLALSMMVVEHVEKPVPFVQSIAERVVPGGIVILGVPGRKDHWSIEDETVGHLRRYERVELAALLSDAGLENVEVWSVAVPVANVLFAAGKRLIERSSSEAEKKNLGKMQQTLTSGIRDIPFKTAFPAPFRLILNQWTMLPFAVFQRLFYQSRFGITILGCGRVPAPTTGS